MFRAIHYFGAFLLFVASILLLITTISAPVVNSISLLRVDSLESGGSITFGTFGYCLINTAFGDQCTRRMIGYDVSQVAIRYGAAGFSEAASNTADGLTRVMILHPITCGLTFISFLVALGAGLVGSLLGVIIGGIAWALTLIVMAVDFTAFGIVRNNINDSDSDAVAYYGSGMWTILAAFILQFFGMVIVFFTCCSKRRERRRERGVVEPKNDYGVAAPRRTGWRRFTRR